MNQQNSEAREALIEARAALRAGQRRTPIIQLSRDPHEAVAFAMAVVLGDSDQVEKRDALGQLAARVDRLLDTSTDASLDEVAASVPLLEAMFVSYTIQAAQTDNIDRKFRLTKMALQCQAAMTRSVIAVQGLKAQRRGNATVTVIDDDNG